MTMYIEDLVITLYNHVKLNSYDHPVISSFSTQLFLNTGFTEKQSVLAIKILKKYSKNLEKILGKPVLGFLDQPQFRITLRKNANNQIKRVSIVDHPMWIKAIKLEFPWNEERVNEIRKSRDNLNLISWIPEEKSWFFALSETNIKFVHSITVNEEFYYDEEFKNLVEQLTNVINSIEDYLPMLILDNETYKFKNVSEFLPKIENKNVLESVFLAKKYGIQVWDDQINQKLLEEDLHPVTRKFLDHTHTDVFEIDSKSEPVECLKDILCHMTPCLFVVPGGSELEKTKMIYNFLIKLGFSYDEMSVMFRLPNTDGKNFNEFVKNCSLNNPITEKTKFVFVSVKLPKPILKSKLVFNSVVSLGRSNVHYTIRNFLMQKENLIYYCESSKQKEFNFGFM